MISGRLGNRGSGVDVSGRGGGVVDGGSVKGSAARTQNGNSLCDKPLDGELCDMYDGHAGDCRMMPDGHRRHDHETCQSSDGPVRFYYAHWPDHGFVVADHVYISCPHVPLEPIPNDGRWTIESIHPLTVRPSFECGDGCHGFITNGKWVPVSGGGGE